MAVTVHKASSVTHKTQSAVQVRTVGMVHLLAAEYIIGMFLNLLSPSEDGRLPLYAMIFLGLHVLIALLLVLGALDLFINALKNKEKSWSKFASYGFFSVLLALGAGMATVSTHDFASEVSSYVMALGFIGAFSSYGYLFYLLRKGNV